MAALDYFLHDAPQVWRTVPPSLAGLVHRITCFDADAAAAACSREIASFVVPIIVSFADPFRIAFDRRPGPSESIDSFVSGLRPGYVRLRADPERRA